MPDYNTGRPGLQVVTIADSAGKSEEIYIDTATGEIVESLQDEKYPWRKRKQANLRLADVYSYGGMDEKASKVHSCSTWLEYLASGDLTQRQLNHFNACKQRLCPVCSTRKARIMATRLLKVLEKVQNDHPGTQLIFLTLTIQNCTGDKLREALDLLTKAWFKLMHRRPIMRAVKGWYRAIEITRNRTKDTYHPHIHGILVVEDDYFVRSSGLYITQAQWVSMWQQSLQVQYKPVVGIQRTKAKPGQPDSNKAAVLEAAKYATKDSEYIDPRMPIAEAAEVARVYTVALARKRMTALGGWMLEASQELALDLEAEQDDLVHDGDGKGQLTEETADFLEEYGWNHGVSNHVLTSRTPNPKKAP